MRKLTVVSITAVALLGVLGTPSAGAKPAAFGASGATRTWLSVMTAIWRWKRRSLSFHSAPSESSAARSMRTPVRCSRNVVLPISA